MINQMLPEVMGHVCDLAMRQYHERSDILYRNKSHLEDGVLQSVNEDEEETAKFYEQFGGCMYDSRTDSFDELNTLKETLLAINRNDQELYLRLMKGVESSQQLKLQDVMGKIGELSIEEKTVKKRLEALEDKLLKKESEN